MMRGLLALAAAAAAVPAAAQIRASVDVVRVEALVTDGGRPVAGLTTADFAVTDNRAPQVVAVRALTREPIDVAIALDVSSSVRGSRLERLRKGVLALVAQLRPDDRATLLTFDSVLALGPRDSRPDALQARLRDLEGRGRTSLVDAVTAALVWSIGRDRPMLILVFSDGRDTSSWTRSDQALALARTSQAVVDAVVTGELLPTSTARIGAGEILAAETPDERFLIDLAAQSGGRVRNGDSGGALAGAFQNALEQFRARYEITYTATSTDAGWHAVEVRVPTKRGVTIHARRGYQR